MTEIAQLLEHAGTEVEIRGWLANKRSSGKIAFLQIRDGSGVVQAVAGRSDLPDAVWEAVEQVTHESTIRVRGVVKEDSRAPSGVELQATDFEILALTDDFPITKKEHGTGFLMEHRHLWLRSTRQQAALRVRSEVSQAIHDFYYERGYVHIDSPILTPAACEGTSTLFETDYFGEPAFLSQSGQLYLEPRPQRSARCTASVRRFEPRSRRPDAI